MILRNKIDKTISVPFKRLKQTLFDVVEGLNIILQIRLMRRCSATTTTNNKNVERTKQESIKQALAG